MMRALRPGFDDVVLPALFGVLFRDSFDARSVADGLRVQLRDLLSGATQSLSANGHGVFCANRITGLPPRTRASGATRDYELTLEDDAGRYLPLRLTAQLPTYGLLAPANALPPAPRPHVPLFSAPARTLGPDVAIVRAQLRLRSAPIEDAATVPAWARVELWCDGLSLGDGVADARGVVLLPARLPPPREPSSSTPPQGFERNRWDVTLRAWWDGTLPADRAPDLIALGAQPERGLLQDAGSGALLGPQVLRAGTPLVVRSDGSPFLLLGA